MRPHPTIAAVTIPPAESGLKRAFASLRSLWQTRQRTTADLLKLYEYIYGFGVAIVLVTSGFAVAAALSFPEPWFFAALAPLGLLAVCAARRWREFRRYAHIPGPKPSFFVGSLRSLLLHEHGARDRALVELHRVYGPVVRVHMAWGNTPFVSLSVAPKELGQKDMDSNRVADGTVLPRSLMGLKRGERHTAHRQQMNPQFAPKAVLQGAHHLEEVSVLYLRTWRAGTTRHGSLKADLHHWSANSLGAFLCSDEWEQRPDLSEYLAAIGELEEAISFRAFHPFFVRWLFPVRARRARVAYRYLFDHLEGAVQRRLQRRVTPGVADGQRRDVLGALVGLKLAPAGGKASWSRGECVEELISLVAGGTDAMSYTLAQALYLLSRNPDVQDEARTQILKTEIPKSGVFPSSIPQIGILQAKDPGKSPGDVFVLNVIHETMRLFPAVPFSSKISQAPARGNNAGGNGDRISIVKVAIFTEGGAMRARYVVAVVVILLGGGVKLTSFVALTSEAAARSRTVAGVDVSQADRNMTPAGEPRRTLSPIPGGGHALNGLVSTYVAWIVAQTGWSAPDHPPIHFVTTMEMATRYGSPENSALELQALYNRTEGVIYLPQAWRPDDLRQKSALLHELVHHVQRSNNIELPCVAAYERQAYDLQIKWLRAQGVDDPYALIGINELGIYMLSVCRDGS